jgi:hypothetical protein
VTAPDQRLPKISATAPREVRPAAKLRSSGWVLKRALLGLVLITVFAASGAALMYATIEPDGQTAAGE